jgi:ribosomal protein S18 acetylase RimI-like enzyme
MSPTGQANVTIRMARPSDADVIAAANAAMAWETEALRLDPGRLGEGVRALLRDPARGFYLVAEDAGRVVGQLMITTEWSDWRNGNFWWIQSVHVAPEHRRRGVFRSLYAAIEARARADASCCGLRLYVERHNERAKATYAALGMQAACYELFEVDFTRESAPGRRP